MAKNPFSGSITDPDIVKAFGEKLITTKEPDRAPAEILVSIAQTHSWNPEDLAILSKLPAEEYYKVFKTGGSDLHKIIDACLQFDRIVNASEPMRAVASRAKEALMRIGEESPINARRVIKYGIKVDKAEVSDESTS